MYIVVFITCSNKKEAKQIAERLIQDKIAACVNIVGKIESIFRWQGRLDKAKEVLLIIKTRKSLMNKLIKKVRELHSYDVPEIIALPVIAGNKKYLEWINDSTR